MKVAIACNGDSVASQTAQCEGLMCYTIERGIITDARNLPNINPTETDLLSVIQRIGFDTLITGAIDERVAHQLCDAGIEVVAGAAGSTREAVDAYLAHTLMGLC